MKAYAVVVGIRLRKGKRILRNAHESVDKIKKRVKLANSLKQVIIKIDIPCPNEKTNLKICEEICNILDEIKPNKKPHKTLIEYVSDRPGHDFRYSINNNKIRKELGWRPKMNFKKGIKKTVDWYYKEIKFAKNK